MKQCPRCNLIYTDDTLEFCLEDGSRLVTDSSPQTETPTVFAAKKAAHTTEKTVNLPFSRKIENFDLKAEKLQNTGHSQSIENKKDGRNLKIIEISAIAVALLHNWWQWLYLNNQYYSTFTAYVLSANFLMWLLLLAIGIGIGLYAVKLARNKSVPIISLVILAVNLILFVVPKR